MRRLAGTLAATLALALAACGGQEADLVLHATPIVLETSAPFARAPDFPARLESTIDAALRYWGGSWGALSGTTITLSGERYVSCGGSPALGCYDGAIRITTADPGTGTFDCVEQTVLVHEIGHAVIGDRLHQDPRWMQFGGLADALSGRAGHAAGGDVACEIFVSVWRHPAGTP